MEEWARLIDALTEMGIHVDKEQKIPRWFKNAVKKYPPPKHNILRWTLKHCPRLIDDAWLTLSGTVEPESRLWKVSVGLEMPIAASETDEASDDPRQFRVFHPGAVSKYAYIKRAIKRTDDWFRSSTRIENHIWRGFAEDWFRATWKDMGKLLVDGHPVDLSCKKIPGSLHGKLQVFRDRLLRAQLHRGVRRMYLPDPSKLLFVRAADLENGVWGDRDRSPACVDSLMYARLYRRFGLRFTEALRIGRANRAWIDEKSAVYIMFVYDPMDPLCAGGVYVGRTKGYPAERVLRHLKQTDYLVDVAIHAVPPMVRCLPCIVAIILESGIDKSVIGFREEVYTRLFCGFGPGGFNMIAASKNEEL